MKRKLTALLLVLTMVIGALPIAASADDDISKATSEAELKLINRENAGEPDGAESGGSKTTDIDSNVPKQSVTTEAVSEEVTTANNHSEETNIVSSDSKGADIVGDVSEEKIVVDNEAEAITEEVPESGKGNETPSHDCYDHTLDCLCDVCGKEYHQHSAYRSDEYGHWTVCAWCNIKLTEPEGHVDADDDGLCDTCKYRVRPCVHNWANNGHDQFSHWQCCTNCGISTSAAHTMQDGICTVCGYTPCAEGHSFTAFWSKTDGYMHKCDICGCLDACTDTDKNCICDICGAELHCFNYVSIDSQNHQEVCEKCGKTRGEPHPHSGYESNGICDYCHYNVREDTPECPHANIDCFADYEGHVIFCLDCLTTITEKESHTMQDGKCTVCGFTSCTNHIYPDYPAEYHTHTCLNCHKSEECVDANHDCVCDVCGQNTHPNYEYNTTEKLHWRFCSDCGQVCDLGGRIHEDLNDDGKCDECGYQMKVETEPDPEPSPDPDPKPDVPETAEPEEGNIVSSNSSTWPVKTVLSKYRTLHEKNPDLYGWITISGAKIDYPVMYSPNNPEKYLNLDFDRNPNQSGTPFLKEQCDLGRDIVVVYAANMEDGSMFHGLLSYAEEAFWRENTEILFDTLYEKGTYEIVAAFYTEEYKEDSADFQIDDILHIRNSQEYKDAVSYIQENAIYDTGVAANYGDGLLTLITDADSSEDGRFVVVAKRK